LSKLTVLSMGLWSQATLPDVVCELVNLETLNLQQSKLETLPESMAKLAKLKRLDIRSCESLAEPLPDLSSLLLGGLKIQTDSMTTCGAVNAWVDRGCTASTVDASLEMIAAGTFVADELSLAGSPMKAVPDSVGTLVQLKRLDVRGCANLEVLPETLFETLANLEELNLERCDKLKTLPGSVAKLAKLKTLNLRNCLQLAEPLPDLSSLNPVNDDGYGRRMESESGAASESRLKIKGYHDSKDAKAWAKRGFKAL